MYFGIVSLMMHQEMTKHFRLLLTLTLCAVLKYFQDKYLMEEKIENRLKDALNYQDLNNFIKLDYKDYYCNRILKISQKS
jgi:hypothetical protein